MVSTMVSNDLLHHEPQSSTKFNVYLNGVRLYRINHRYMPLFSEFE
jgi:hypothetical protein